MAFIVSSATVPAFNRVRVTFSETYVANAALFLRNNYAFSAVRGGVNIEIYAASVAEVNSTSVDVTLTDAMETDTLYSVTVINVLSSASGKLIQDDGQNSTTFIGMGIGLKTINLRRLMPSKWNTRYGSNFFAVLGSIGSLLESAGGVAITSGINQVFSSLVLRLAEDAELSYLAQNYGVTRPDWVSDNDDLFRVLVPIYATKRKTALKIFYEAFEAVLGPSSTGFWRIYEIRENELIVEVPSATLLGLISGQLDTATYFHADASIPSAGTFPGDYLLADAVQTRDQVGNNIVLLFQLSAISAAVEDIVSRVKAAGIEFQIITT